MTVAVYQIQYSDAVVGAFDPAFIRYDCRHAPEAQRREIAHMLRFYEEGRWRQSGASHFGLVSPKFVDKTGLSGQAFIDWIDAHPGYDVYFVNPFPQLSYWHYNVWDQGEFWHPGLSALANTLFARAGETIRVERLPRNAAASLLYSNYWVANDSFWQRFMTFVRKLADAVDDLDAADKEKLFARAPHYAPATYFPFVFERLFSTFLVTCDGLACLPYPHARAEVVARCTNEMERFVVREWGDLIDAWDAGGRSGDDYRKLLANLHGMLQLYQAATPRGVTAAPRRRSLLGRFGAIRSR
ncbi:MAG: hypothetical protein RQ754_15305 [Desulfuromonadales bacterium]|nr:hypothetical protein [Desulfuromonadales bacterium]